jgi:hypothetical protein
MTWRAIPARPDRFSSAVSADVLTSLTALTGLTGSGLRGGVRPGSRLRLRRAASSRRGADSQGLTFLYFSSSTEALLCRIRWVASVSQ